MISTSQTFCTGATIADIAVPHNQIRWYDAATGGNVLASDFVLVGGATYHAATTAGSCESSLRTAVTINISNTPLPPLTGPGAQTVLVSGTLADLQVTGSSIIWYDASSSGAVLPLSTPLVNGTTYYAAQSTGVCESSSRLAVTVTIILCGGSGSAIDPYQICTVEDLEDLANYVNGGNGDDTDDVYFKLMNDLDMDDRTTSDPEGWTPIGDNSTISSATWFQGNFDGNGNVIKNLFINRPATDYIGLFGYVNGATIERLGIENCNITGHNLVGGLVGETQYGGTNVFIRYCYVTGNINGNYDVGGLMGRLWHGTIENCYANVNVTQTVTGNFAGGLAGYNDAGTNIRYCYAAGTVNGRGDAGGLVGQSRGFIYNCVAANESVITTTSTGVQRILGRNLGGAFLATNYANEDMAVLRNTSTPVTISSGLSSSDGQNAAMATLKSFAHYSTGGNWSGGPAWDIDNTINPAKIWRICEYGSLPYFQWQQGITCPAETDFGLIFDVTTEKFYLDIAGDGDPTNVINIIYTGQSTNWSYSSNTLYLENFEWETTAPAALLIVGGDMDMDITGTNSFTSVFDGTAAGSNGIYFDAGNRTLNISGSGTLNVAAGNATNTGGTVNIQGIYGNVTLNSGTLNVTTGNGTGNNVWVCGIRGDVTQDGGIMNVTAGNATGSSVSSIGIHGDALTLNDGTLYATGATDGISISGGTIATVTITGGTLYATGSGTSGVGIDAAGGTTTTVSITGGTVKAQGNSRAISFPSSTTLTLPGFYKWTKSANFDGTPPSTETYPSTPFSNTDNPKYVKIEGNLADFGLIFDKTTEKFYLDIAGTGVVNPNLEYTGQSANWSFSNETLYLENFEWETPAPKALTIVGGDININIEGINRFTSTFDGSNVMSLAGIYAFGDRLTIDGSGVLTATGGNNTYNNASSYGMFAAITLNSGTVIATSGNSYGSSRGIYSVDYIFLYGGTLLATGGTGKASNGIWGHVTVSNNSNLTAIGGTATEADSYGIDGILTVNGGIITTQGETRAITQYYTVTPPAGYEYWTHTLAADPGGAGTTVPGGVAFDNTADIYKFVKIEASLIYNPSDVAVVNGLIGNNGLLWTTYTDPTYRSDPGWPSAAAVWVEMAGEMRLVRLYITDQSPAPLTGTLDFTGGLSELYELTITDPSVTAVNVSTLTGLEEFFCHDTQITSLDMSGCTALVNMECDRNMQLTTLTLGTHNVLTQINLIDCPNLSGTIDASGCPLLDYLQIGNTPANPAWPVGAPVSRLILFGGYDLSFNESPAGSGTVRVMSNGVFSSAHHNAPILLSAIPGAGNTFAEWTNSGNYNDNALAPNGQGDPAQFNMFSFYLYNVPASTAVTATANFNVPSPPSLHVTYDANGGTGTQTDPNNPYLGGAKVTVMDVGNIAYVNHIFTGWNTKPNGSGTTYIQGNVFTINDDITLYAQWEDNYAYPVYQRLITIEPAANGRTVSDLTYARTGQTVTLSILPDPGYLLDSIMILQTVYKAAPIPAPKPVSVSGESNVRTFAMPPHEVTVRATFTPSTSVETNHYPSLQAYVQDRVLHVSGLTAGEPLRVYNMLGMLVYQGVADNETAKIPLPAHGIYLVNDGKKTVKAVN